MEYTGQKPSDPTSCAQWLVQKGFARTQQSAYVIICVFLSLVLICGIFLFQQHRSKVRYENIKNEVEVQLRAQNVPQRP